MWYTALTAFFDSFLKQATEFFRGLRFEKTLVDAGALAERDAQKDQQLKRMKESNDVRAEPVPVSDTDVNDLVKRVRDRRKRHTRTS